MATMTQSNDITITRLADRAGDASNFGHDVPMFSLIVVGDEHEYVGGPNFAGSKLMKHGTGFHDANDVVNALRDAEAGTSVRMLAGTPWNA